MPVNPKRIKSSVEDWTSPYAASTRSEGESPTSTLLHRRLGDNKHFELLPGSSLYATPWDVSTPEAGHEFIRGPLLPPKDGYPSNHPLLQTVDYGDQDTPDSMRVRFSALDLAATTFDEGSPIIDEFGSTPSSANSRTAFVRPPTTRSALRNRRKNSLWIPGSHPWWPDYEPVHWLPLILLLAAAPFTIFLLWIASVIAHNRSLFWTRSIVNVATSVLGFILGTMLMEVGRRLLEAATWATIVHHSMFVGRSGITLSDLASKSDQTRFTWLGFSLLYERLKSPATQRRNRTYDQRAWSCFVLFFLVISLVAASISFLLGRLVNITTTESRQSQFYQEVSLMGDLTVDDIARSVEQLNVTESFVSTWTLSPYGSGGQTPQPVNLQSQGQNVFFTELSEQLLSGEVGYGTFQQAPGASLDNTTPPNLDTISSGISNNGISASGSVIRFSRWGLRINCTKLPNPQTNIVPLSPNNITYAFIPKAVVNSLVSKLGLKEATPFPLLNSSDFLQGDDKVPEDIDMTDIAHVGVFWNNGIAQSFYSNPIDQGGNGTGWVELDVAMLRLNVSYTPQGYFPVHSPNGSLGYDAVVCVEAIEPWVVDAYNATTGRATTFSIVGKGGISTLPFNYGKRKGPPVSVPLNSTLNSIGKFNVFALAHDNSRNQILKDNSRDNSWVPDPTAILWTGENGPWNYTTLSADYVENALGKADAAQLLPYLIGSQPILAYRYPDNAVASAELLLWPTVGTLMIILLLGFSAAFLVPRLPLSIPRRDFGVFTWLAAFEGDDLLHEVVEEGLDRNMDLEELQRRYGSQKVRYGA